MLCPSELQETVRLRSQDGACPSCSRGYVKRCRYMLTVWRPESNRCAFQPTRPPLDPHGLRCNRLGGGPLCTAYPSPSTITLRQRRLSRSRPGVVHTCLRGVPGFEPGRITAHACDPASFRAFTVVRPSLALGQRVCQFRHTPPCVSPQCHDPGCRSPRPSFQP